MTTVFEKPKIADRCAVLHYCPGCTHGIVHRLVAECIDELGIEGRTIGIAPVGCSVLAYNYFTCDMIEAAHGRAPAVATGVKRVAARTTSSSPIRATATLPPSAPRETVHAAASGENITVIFINNAIYGMTGGQMAPTTPARTDHADLPLRPRRQEPAATPSAGLRDARHARRRPRISSA